MLATFQYVEDYIEYIAGHKDINGQVFNLFNYQPNPINLARYDVTVIDSLSQQTILMKNPYTDKQSQLAIRIITKYRRQLAALSQPVFLPEDVSSFKFRLGVRIVDRTKSITVDRNEILVKFPFDTKMIDTMKSQVREGQGHAAWDPDRKVWTLGLTEYMVNWVMYFAQANNFTVSDELQQMYQSILDCEQNPYKIELVLDNNNTLKIANATDSLIEYINEHLGGFGYSNLLKLIDAAPTLGYTVDHWLFNCIPVHNKAISMMLTNRTYKFLKEGTTLDDTLEYARLVNRLPVYVYDVGLPKPNTEEIIYLNRGVDIDVKPKLMVTLSGLMIGSKKQAWVNNAEKIIILE
jgi:hypothetical protein